MNWPIIYFPTRLTLSSFAYYNSTSQQLKCTTTLQHWDLAYSRCELSRPHHAAHESPARLSKTACMSMMPFVPLMVTEEGNLSEFGSVTRKTDGIEPKLGLGLVRVAPRSRCRKDSCPLILFLSKSMFPGAAGWLSLFYGAHFLGRHRYKSLRPRFASLPIRHHSSAPMYIRV